MCAQVYRLTHEPDWNDKLERLHSAAVTIAAAQDVSHALQAVVDCAREIIHAEIAALGVPGKIGEPMAHFAVSGIPQGVHARIGNPPTGRGFLGIMLRNGSSIRVANVHDHPAFEGYSEEHPQVTSFLGVPIRNGGEVVGDLYLANKIHDEKFTEDDQHLIEMLAAHAGVVIRNLRYQEQVRNVGLLQERARLAHQLQDDVLQAMYGGGLLLNAIDLTNAESAAEQLQQVQGLLSEAIDHLRAHLQNLQPPL